MNLGTSSEIAHTGTEFEAKNYAIGKSWLINFVQWVGYLALLLTLAMPAGFKSEFVYPWRLGLSPLSIRPFSTVKDIIRDFRPTDLATYASAAVLISGVGKKEKEILALLPAGNFSNKGPLLDDVFAYWPPGLPLLQAVVLKLIGTNGPFILCLILAYCTTWSFVLWNLYVLAKRKAPVVIAYFLPMIICCSGLLRCNLLRIGVLCTESISIGFMCLSFLLLIRSSLERRKSLAIAAGAVLAAAAYFRAQIEIIALVLTVLVVLISGLLFVDTKFRGPRHWHGLKSPLYLLLLAVLTFNCLTIPYRLYNFCRFHTLSWQRIDSYWKLNWPHQNMSLKKLLSSVDISGINIPSLIDPLLAKKIEDNIIAHGYEYYPASFYKWSTIRTFLHHPYRWFCLKVPLLPRLWFWPAYVADGYLAHLWTLENYLDFLFLGLCGILILSSLRVNRCREVDIVHLFLFGALIVASFCTFVLVHMESRYFFVIKMGVVVILFSLLCAKMPDKADESK